MKKITTLFASLIFITVAIAQNHSSDDNRYNNGRDRDYADGRFEKNDHKNNNDRMFSNRERDMQIARINNEYDRKIESVKHRWFMSRHRKAELIASLQAQRNHEIRMMYERYEHGSRRFADNDSGRRW